MENIVQVDSLAKMEEFLPGVKNIKNYFPNYSFFVTLEPYSLFFVYFADQANPFLHPLYQADQSFQKKIYKTSKDLTSFLFFRKKTYVIPAQLAQEQLPTIQPNVPQKFAYILLQQAKPVPQKLIVKHQDTIPPLLDQLRDFLTLTQSIPLSFNKDTFASLLLHQGHIKLPHPGLLEETSKPIQAQVDIFKDLLEKNLEMNLRIQQRKAEEEQQQARQAADYQEPPTQVEPTQTTQEIPPLERPAREREPRQREPRQREPEPREPRQRETESREPRQREPEPREPRQRETESRQREQRQREQREPLKETGPKDKNGDKDSIDQQIEKIIKYYPQKLLEKIEKNTESLKVSKTEKEQIIEQLGLVAPIDENQVNHQKLVNTNTYPVQAPSKMVHFITDFSQQDNFGDKYSFISNFGSFFQDYQTNIINQIKNNKFTDFPNYQLAFLSLQAQSKTINGVQKNIIASYLYPMNIKNTEFQSVGSTFNLISYSINIPQTLVKNFNGIEKIAKFVKNFDSSELDYEKLVTFKKLFKLKKIIAQDVFPLVVQVYAVSEFFFSGINPKQDSFDNVAIHFFTLEEAPVIAWNRFTEFKYIIDPTQKFIRFKTSFSSINQLVQKQTKVFSQLYQIDPNFSQVNLQRLSYVPSLIISPSFVTCIDTDEKNVAICVNNEVFVNAITDKDYINSLLSQSIPKLDQSFISFFQLKFLTGRQKKFTQPITKLSTEVIDQIKFQFVQDLSQNVFFVADALIFKQDEYLSQNMIEVSLISLQNQPIKQFYVLAEFSDNFLLIPPIVLYNQYNQLDLTRAFQKLLV